MNRVIIFISFALLLGASAVANAQAKLPCVSEVELATAAAQKSKDYSQALAKAEECIRKNPKSIDALFARAGVYSSKGDLDLALVDANKAIERDPKSSEAYYRRGQVYDKKARTTFLSDEAASKAVKKEASEAAYADYDRSLALDPQKGEALLKKTALRGYFMGSGFRALVPDYDRAIEILNSANKPIALAEAYYERGNNYAADMRRELAIADYTSAIKLRPDYSAAYLMRATNYGIEFFNPVRNIDAAIADYTRAMELEPASAYVYTSRAGLYEAKGETSKAVADYNAALALEPNNYTAKTRLAKLAPATVAVKPVTPQTTQPSAEQFAAAGRRQILQKDYDGAIRSLSECLRIKPDAAPCYAFRGYAHGMKGEMAAANSDHDAAVKLSPNEAALYLIRGMMFTELGKKTEAVTEFRHVLKLDPNNKQALAALQGLGVDSP